MRFVPTIPSSSDRIWSEFRKEFNRTCIPEIPSGRRWQKVCQSHRPAGSILIRSTLYSSLTALLPQHTLSLSLSLCGRPNLSLPSPSLLCLFLLKTLSNVVRFRPHPTDPETVRCWSDSGEQGNRKFASSSLSKLIRIFRPSQVLTDCSPLLSNTFINAMHGEHHKY